MPCVPSLVQLVAPWPTRGPLMLGGHASSATPSSALMDALNFECFLSRAAPLLRNQFETLLSPTNVFLSDCLQYFQVWLNMISFRTLASFTYLTQVIFAGGNVQSNCSLLEDIVPRREVLYVGGRYTNVTVSLGSHQVIACLRLEIE